MQVTFRFQDQKAPDHFSAAFRFTYIMGMFHNLMAKIFAHGPATATPAPASSTPSPATGSAPTQSPGAPSANNPTAAPTAPAASAAAPVDITAVLDGLAANNPEDLDWKRSIVDMLKLVGMDSSLSARKELADDLHYSGDKSDSATMNGWLHAEVLKKLAANGGKVPAELLG